MQQAQVQRRSYAGLIAIAIGIIVAISMVTSYNALVTLDQGVQAQWGQVQNVYQRRADLIPNLVATVKGAANFEKSTYIAVTEARAKVGQISPDVIKNATNNQAALSQYQSAQDNLGSALSRLLVVVENYPQLKANENFNQLQAQLEETETRISQARRFYNANVREMNTAVETFPSVMVAGAFGFTPAQYFELDEAAARGPVKVQF